MIKSIVEAMQPKKSVELLLRENYTVVCGLNGCNKVEDLLRTMFAGEDVVKVVATVCGFSKVYIVYFADGSNAKFFVRTVSMY